MGGVSEAAELEEPSSAEQPTRPQELGKPCEARQRRLRGGLAPLLLGRAALLGLIGTFLAFIISIASSFTFPPITWVLTPLASAASAWLPTIYALTKDPVTVLRHD